MDKELKTFFVSFCGRIPHDYDFTYVLAHDEYEAERIVVKNNMLNTRPLTPDFLNKYCNYFVKEA